MLPLVAYFVVVAAVGCLIGGLHWLVGPQRRRSVRPTRAQRIARMQAKRAELAQAIANDELAAGELGRRARDMARSIQGFQWDAEFLRLQGQATRADRLRAAVPQRERIIVTSAKQLDTLVIQLQLQRVALGELDKRIRRARRWAWLDL